MSIDAVMVWRLAPEQADCTEPCAIQVALHRHAGDGHALHRV